MVLPSGCSSSHEEPCPLRFRVEQGAESWGRCAGDAQIIVTQDDALGGCRVVTSNVTSSADDFMILVGSTGDAFATTGTHRAIVQLFGSRVCGGADWCRYQGDCELEVTTAATVGEELVAHLSPCAIDEVTPIDHPGPVPTVRSLEISGIVGAEPVSDGGVCE